MQPPQERLGVRPRTRSTRTRLPSVSEGIAKRAVLDARFVKGERERLLTSAFMIRVIVLTTLMPDAGVREAVTALAGDLPAVPWARPWRASSAPDGPVLLVCP